MGWFSSNSMKKIYPEPYKGDYPWTPGMIGWDETQIKPMAQQYLQQIMERSRGEGMVGYPSEYRSTLQKEFLADSADREAEQRRIEQSQASSQGLRGGVPMDIARQRAKDYERARSSGLAGIDIADMEARRADINQATYAQPDLAQQAANMMAQKSAFDAGIWKEMQPTYIDQKYSNTPEALAGLFGQYQDWNTDMAMKVLGAGGTGSGGIGASGATSGANKSLSNSYLKQYSEDPFKKVRESLRSY